MTRYIALLRGVNVGGNNKISMAVLKDVFLHRGFENVRTYIQSGNILFDCNLTPPEAKEACEVIIELEFGLKIVVGIIPAADLTEALKHAPDWWNEDKASKHNAIFVIPPATAATVIIAVGKAKEEFEKVAYYGNVIFWSAPVKTFSRTRWSKVVQDKELYALLTIRNANTTLRLDALAQDV